MLVAAAVLFRAGRGLTFLYDEWEYIVYRRAWSAHTLLDPENQNLTAIPLAVYKLLLSTVGLRHYWPYRLTLIGFHLLSSALLFVLARRRLGAWPAVAVTACFLFLGSAFSALLWPGNLGFVVATAAALGALVCLDAASLRGDVAASVLIGGSIASWGLGLGIAAGAAVEVLLRGGARRLWVALTPLAAYALWFGVDGPRALAGGGSFRSNVTAVPSYVADAAAGAVGAVAGLGLSWGRVGLVVLVAVGVWSGRGRASPRLWALTAAAATYWAVAALGRAQLHDPAASRYVYFGAALVLLVLVELAHGLAFRGPAAVVLAGAVAVAVVANLGALRTGQAGIHTANDPLRTELTALELAGPGVPASFTPDRPNAWAITAGSYAAAVAALGSPADTPAELRREPELLRRDADVVFAGALGVQPRPAAGASCRAVASGTELEPRDGTLVVRASERVFAAVSIRRFADGYDPRSARRVPPGEARSFTLPARPAPGTWHVRVTAAAGTIRICS